MPNVEYIVRSKNGEEIVVDNPAQFPPEGKIDHVREPFVRVEIVTPSEYVGGIMTLNQDRRGVYLEMTYVTRDRAVLRYDMPLAEILIDYYDKLKSLSRGYASLDYNYIGHRESNVVRLDIAINGDPVDALDDRAPRQRVQHGTRPGVEVKEVIPRQCTRSPFRPASAPGAPHQRQGDAKRHRQCTEATFTQRKLLEKQKSGKRRMKMVGKVEIPQEAFLAVLKVERTS
jgi:GTP-binding protein LepA